MSLNNQNQPPPQPIDVAMEPVNHSNWGQGQRMDGKYQYSYIF